MSIYGAAAGSISSPAATHLGNWERQQEAKRQDSVNDKNWYRGALTDWMFQKNTRRYNSPKNQMKRFKEAGLNPHLIYGQGTPGNAAEMSSPDAKNAAKADVETMGNPFEMFTNLSNIGARTDNVEAATAVDNQQAIYLAAKTHGEIISNKEHGGTWKHNVDIVEENLKQAINATTNSDLNTHVNAVTQPARIKQIEAQADKAAEELHGVKLRNSLQQIELNFAEEGVYKTDPFWARQYLHHKAKYQKEGYSTLEIFLKQVIDAIPSNRLAPPKF